MYAMKTCTLAVLHSCKAPQEPLQQGNNLGRPSSLAYPAAEAEPAPYQVHPWCLGRDEFATWSGAHLVLLQGESYLCWEGATPGSAARDRCVWGRESAEILSHAPCYPATPRKPAENRQLSLLG